MAATIYKHLILIVLAITILGLGLIVKLWPHAINKTFSQHVARHKTAIIYYIVLFAVILPLLLVFTFKWFVPTFHPSKVFEVSIVIASVCQFACALVPETGGIKTTTHQMLAYLSADCLLPATISIVFTTRISSAGRVVAMAASICMSYIIATFVRAYAKNNGQHNYLLLLQASYFALFFTALIAATYT